VIRLCCLIVPEVVKVSVTTLPVNTEVLISWETPSQSNGNIVGYLVFYSLYNSDTSKFRRILNNSTRNYTIRNLSKLGFYMMNYTYHDT